MEKDSLSSEHLSTFISWSNRLVNFVLFAVNVNDIYYAIIDP